MFENTLMNPSQPLLFSAWLISMALFTLSVLMLVKFHRMRLHQARVKSILCLLATASLLGLSLAEFSQISILSLSQSKAKPMEWAAVDDETLTVTSLWFAELFSEKPSLLKVGTTIPASSKRHYGAAVDQVKTTLFFANQPVRAQGVQIEQISDFGALTADDKFYDMITFAQPLLQPNNISETLHTIADIKNYLRHLNQQGIINIIQPIQTEEIELPIWQITSLFRKALTSLGYAYPDNHLFIGQWKTQSEQHLQILLKKTPFSPEELSRIKNKIAEYNQKHREILQRQEDAKALARIDIIYSPLAYFESDHAQKIRGELAKAICLPTSTKEQDHDN